MSYLINVWFLFWIIFRSLFPIEILVGKIYGQLKKLTISIKFDILNVLKTFLTVSLLPETEGRNSGHGKGGFL